MNVKQAAAMAGVTVKALKYYESIRLVQPARSPNGYRDFSAQDIDLIKQVKELTAVGLSVNGTRPFIECLRQGHLHGDDCPESLAAYHAEINRLDGLVMELASRRQMLHARLVSAASRGFTPEACGFRDNFADLLDAGLDAIYGLSSQQSRYQHELVERLRLPYPMLSDRSFALEQSLGLPTFEVGASTFYKRLTMVI